MRYVVLIFGLLGVIGSGFLTYKWGTDWMNGREKVADARKLLESQITVFRKLRAGAGADSSSSPLQVQLSKDVAVQNENMANFYRYGRCVPFLLAAAVLGLFGTLVSFNRHGFSGALLLIVVGAGPAAFVPSALMFSGSLIVAGFFSLFVRQPRPKQLAPVDDLDEVDE